MLATFCIFRRDGVSPCGQADLELLTSSDPPTSASQSAGIIGVSHLAWFFVFFETESCSVAQVKVKWYNLGSPKPLPPGLEVILLPQPPE